MSKKKKHRGTPRSEYKQQTHKVDTPKKQRRSRIIINVCRVIGIATFALCIIIGLFLDDNPGRSYMNAFIAFLFIVLSYLPEILSREFKLHLPANMQAAIVLFIFAAEILGEISEFYIRFFWWDSLLHMMSGFIIGYIGFMIIYSLNRDPKVRIQMSMLGICGFAFCFAVTCGVIWEVFEWSGDLLFGMNMQKSVYVSDVAELGKYINRWGRFMDPGLMDTMKDLIVDMIGALISAIFGYATIKESRDEDLPIPDYFD